MNPTATSAPTAADMKEVPCPLCGSLDHRLYVWAPSHYGPEKLRVTRCQSCGMIFTNPQLVTYIDEVEHRGVQARHFAPAMLEKQRRIARLELGVLGRLVQGRRALDFGCGEGTFVHEAVASGWDAVGIDLNAGLVAAGNRHWGFNALHSGTLEDFQAGRPAPFDAIVTSQVFEHLQQPVEMGKALLQLLRPGGVLYIDVPNANQLGEWKERGRTLDPTAHWNHFTTTTLRRLMERIGASVIYTTAAPSLVNVYHRLGLTRACYPLARLTRRVLPGIGTGVCVIGRKPNR